VQGQAGLLTQEQPLQGLAHGPFSPRHQEPKGIGLRHVQQQQTRQGTPCPAPKSRKKTPRKAACRREGLHDSEAKQVTPQRSASGSASLRHSTSHCNIQHSTLPRLARSGNHPTELER